MGPTEDLVRQFAAQLADITHEFEQRLGQVETASHGTSEESSDAPPVAIAASMLARRRARKTFFSADLFHEPAWDMLLALFIAHHEGRTLFVKVLVGSSDAPATTSQRWIDHLHRLGLVRRVVDPVDRRRIEIALSEAGETAMTGYLEAVRRR